MNNTRRKATIKKRRAAKKKSGFPKFILCVISFLLISFAGWKVWNSDFVQMRFVYMWDYQQEIIDYSQKNNIDPFLVAAIIKNESNFKHNAISDAGAIGLMQIMPETGTWIANQMGLAEYKDNDLYVAKTNIRMGCWYVGELEHEFKHNSALLMIAYNAGRGQTKSWMEKNNWDYDFNDLEAIPYTDTREYVSNVLRDREKYRLLYQDKLLK